MASEDLMPASCLSAPVVEITCRTCGGSGEHPDENDEPYPTCEGDGIEEEYADD